jgi:predicted TIM-barrel fold metal-dependent hydrolase
MPRALHQSQSAATRPKDDARSQVSRREWLRIAASGALCSVASWGRTTTADEVDLSGHIDAHSHIWTRDVERYPLASSQTLADLNPPSFTAEELLETCRPVGVTRVVLIQHKPYHGVDNSYIRDTIAKYPGVFSAVACIELDDAARPAADIRRELDELRQAGVRGIRIRPGEGGAARWEDSPGMQTLWTHAATTRMAVCPLINPENLPEVETMCRRFRDTPVVVDHFARIGVDGELREADITRLVQLARHPLTYVKLSAFYALGRKRPPHTELIPMIVRLLDAFGSARLMWASDAPYQLQSDNTYSDSLALIRERMDGLSADDRDWLLRKTAARVYFGDA